MKKAQEGEQKTNTDRISLDEIPNSMNPPPPVFFCFFLLKRGKETWDGIFKKWKLILCGGSLFS